MKPGAVLALLWLGSAHSLASAKKVRDPPPFLWGFLMRSPAIWYLAIGKEYLLAVALVTLVMKGPAVQIHSPAISQLSAPPPRS